MTARSAGGARGNSDEGPGDDWTCTIRVASGTPGELETVGYDVSVESDGCYKATAPPTFVGQQTMSDAHGHTVVNPLFIIYGCFDVIGSASAAARRPPPAPPIRRTPAPPARLRHPPPARPKRRACAKPNGSPAAAVVRKINEAERRAPNEREPGTGEPAQPGR